MYTDPNHIRVEDPGTVEGNVVFAFLDAFDDVPNEVEELKAHYRRGGLGDSVVKRRLEERLQTLLEPIRVRREDLQKDTGYLRDVLRVGTEKARERAAATTTDVRKALGLSYF